ncbi:MAG: glycosyltransferase family 4 protein [Planctomycetes bacterium]|nr:glycosyltransferase family 4 protein [Planctomycetota bacterium]
MRVALVHLRHAHTGGTERYLNLVAGYLAERGDDVTIVCRSHESPPHPAVRFVKLRPLAIGGTARIKTFARAVEKHVRATAYDVVYDLGRAWTHDVVRLGGGCQATYLELAHAATLKPWEKFVGARAGKHRLALAIEARALGPGNYKRVVVNSKMVAEDVARRHGVPREKIELVYNGVDLERYSPAHRATMGALLRAELGIGPDERVVLFLGSGYGRKGLDVVLEAFARVARDDSSPHADGARAGSSSHAPSAPSGTDSPASSARSGPLRLAVVGYDSEQPRFEARAAELGLAARASFLGGRRDTEACYALGDLYVLPTRYDPFANTTLEALASGLPAITSATNGASELITEDVDGAVLARADDVDALERALRRWIVPERLATGARAARALAEQHSARSKCAQSAALLDRVAAEKRAELAAR